MDANKTKQQIYSELAEAIGSIVSNKTLILMQVKIKKRISYPLSAIYTER
jgi:hypothetical protein